MANGAGLGEEGRGQDQPRTLHLVKQRAMADVTGCQGCEINAQLEQHSPPAWASPPNSTRPMQAVEDRLVPASSDFQAHIMAPKEVNSGKVGHAS
ncbi:hypothetical protein SNOG_06730 [Parastagonospora nodorum SN15]|uniref:Uncharacterized protein n=1 Tax=Phaeosphaeria nodorum (strain SN15 / ATCC MYA-4574 / FGSC 10173) TaxID=321614 RepID=Q0UND4_PHANO|nr:hypothetical protein SNOG_06730 [Parastagonospora nodorum SN15]EAT85381.1 hypothetical protein SNOG_06730 [Parastagonospora nodorum SN15]